MQLFKRPPFSWGEVRHQAHEKPALLDPRPHPSGERHATQKTDDYDSSLALQACITIEQDGAETYVNVENVLEADDDCCEDDCCEEEGDCCDDGCDDTEEELEDTGTYEDTGDTGTYEEEEEEEEEVSVTEEEDGSVDVESEVRKLDIAFLLDTTSSMSEEAAAMARNFVDDIAATVEDAAYGFATFDDYASGSMGYPNSGDKPFVLRQQITQTESSVQAVLNNIQIHSGADNTESGMEALYQGLLGMGYDQNADGLYDTTTDVLPFIASDSIPLRAWLGRALMHGRCGGYGFREGTLPVVIYATDATMRDPSAGHSSPNGAPLMPALTTSWMPSASWVLALIGVATQSSSPLSQMQSLATATGSLYEADGDGLIDDALVFSWSATASSEDFRNTIVTAIQEMIGSVTFSEITVEVVGDDYGSVVSTNPESYTNVTVGSDGLDLDSTLL